MTYNDIKIFLASSVEGLGIARELKSLLDYDFDVTIWDEGIFSLSTQPIERLEEIKQNFAFAIFILSPDDCIRKRDEEGFSARDNVILELGFFMGVIGRRRCFMVHPRKLELFKPSDALGLHTATYDPDRGFPSALGAAAQDIRRSIQEILEKDTGIESIPPVRYFDFRNLPYYNMEIQKACKRIWIQSLRIKGFLQDHRSDNGARLLAAIKRGTQVRILVPDYTLRLSIGKRKLYQSSEVLSIFCGEGETGASWLESIRRANAFIKQIHSEAAKLTNPDKGTIELRLHCSPVTTMIFLIDDILYFGPYLAYSDSIKAPTFRVTARHPLYSRLTAHFDDIWRDRKLSRGLEEVYE